MKKTLVAYFSATGTTAAAAKQLAAAAGADLYEIKPAVPYTKEDLNWMNKKSRSSVEMNDKSFRPELADKNSAISGYELVLVGFPIWWCQSGGAPALRPGAVAQSPGREAALAWASLAQRFPASSVLAREGAGCGSVGDVTGAWLASAPLSPSLWT